MSCCGWHLSTRPSKSLPHLRQITKACGRSQIQQTRPWDVPAEKEADGLVQLEELGTGRRFWRGKTAGGWAEPKEGGPNILFIIFFVNLLLESFCTGKCCC